ncbi:hypothetical protein AVEN_203271-1 [Araneus ventricosus]|uniref:Uncharacterized protein n=1 Tax=Araneus ventricosus TaxID=182803 RepID=A0A4Y2I394_ARAVE|nr:hypothetical protein AVEN_203271-1 [Araneus ventricosus]
MRKKIANRQRMITTRLCAHLLRKESGIHIFLFTVASIFKKMTFLLFVLEHAFLQHLSIAGGVHNYVDDGKEYRYSLPDGEGTPCPTGLAEFLRMGRHGLLFKGKSIMMTISNFRHIFIYLLVLVPGLGTKIFPTRKHSVPDRGQWSSHWRHP